MKDANTPHESERIQSRAQRGKRTFFQKASLLYKGTELILHMAWPPWFIKNIIYNVAGSSHEAANYFILYLYVDYEHHESEQYLQLAEPRGNETGHAPPYPLT